MEFKNEDEYHAWGRAWLRGTKEYIDKAAVATDHESKTRLEEDIRNSLYILRNEIRNCIIHVGNWQLTYGDEDIVYYWMELEEVVP